MAGVLIVLGTLAVTILAAAYLPDILWWCEQRIEKFRKDEDADR